MPEIHPHVPPEAFRQVRLSAGLTQRDLALRLKVRDSTVSNRERVEAGQFRRVNVRNWRAWAETCAALELDPVETLGAIAPSSPEA